MSCTRRRFLSITAIAAAGNCLPTRLFAAPTLSSEIQAIAFDAFPIFDPRPITVLAERLFPNRGLELTDVWRTRQFEYTWLRTMEQDYADFWQVTQDALEFAAARLKVDLSPQKRDDLMNAYLALKAWPDVMPTLATLKKSGRRLAFLSNFTPHMLAENIQNAGLTGYFDTVISTDSARTYKPDPQAYQLGVERLKLKREQILFVAFAGWDAAGARHFGYPTFWLNRQKQPAEKLGAQPDATGETLAGVVSFLA